MSLHKLTAGDGYTYLTRQVAAQDVTHRGKDALSDYYSQQGESPGRWLSTGAPGLPGFPESLTVTEDQMVALFGEGRHPDALRIEKEMAAAGHEVPAILAATRLGSPYKVHNGATKFRVQLAIRYQAWNADAGLPQDWPIPEPERARIRTELSRELFTEQYGRAPLDDRELSGFVAKASAQPTTATAGYDLTFTPVKSVSTLWAVAPQEVAAEIEACHDEVVTETVQWLEENAAYTRRGRNGVRQVDVHGLLAAAFTHRDSRAGDPNLHTHVAVSNKVQALDGSWLALDGRPIHKMAVAASERYNTRLEALLVDRLGVAFTERAGTEPGKRPVREIVGVDAALAASWSARRASIDVRRAELAGQFQASHGRPPSPVEALKLAQRATLETRQGKHAPRSLAEQRATWRADALRVLGGHEALEEMVGAAQRPAVGRAPSRVVVDADWVADTAETVLTNVASRRATWQEAHVRAEAERQVRAANVVLDQVPEAVERIVAGTLSPAWSLPLGVAEPVSEPAALRRQDGTSMYSTAGTQLYTSAAVVAAERSLIASARLGGGRTASPAAVEAALLASAAAGVTLNPGQAALVRELATSGARLQLALAPAGTGKTTAMAVLTKAWTDDGGTVIGLAPSAAAAAVLGAELNSPTDTLAKLIWSLDTLDADPAEAVSPGQHRRGSVPDWVRQIGPDTLVVLDEAGMAGTPELARAVEFVLDRGGSVRLIGDDQQLAAVGAGGVLRDVAETAGALTLSQVVRFHDPAEGAASIALRAGDKAAIGFYIDRGRVHVGDPGTTTDAAYNAWSADRAAGRDSLMLAPTREVAATLNARARADRLAAQVRPVDAGSGVVGRELQLADGSTASSGDTVITRRNNRRLAISTTDWVKNGDRWTVQHVHDNGALQVQHLATGRHVLLPAEYAREHVALGYANTVHSAQGSTAEVCHTVATGAESRQLLYVAMTRGKAGNHLYLHAATDGDEHSVITPDTLRPPTAVELLTRIVTRDGSQTSATTAQRELAAAIQRLADAADRYHDSLGIAAEELLGPDQLAELDAAADRALPGLTSAPAYATLRAHVALLAVDGHDPETVLIGAIGRHDLTGAHDRAAVLDWRLDPTGQHGVSTGRGPLPWLPAIPNALAADPDWGEYLHARASHTAGLADRIRTEARGWTPTSAPAWATALLEADPELVAALAVWRAAQRVDDDDLRVTGPPKLSAADRRAQRALQEQVDRAAHRSTAAGEPRWTRLARTLEPRLLQDPFWPQLADRLAAADRAGIDITGLAERAAEERPLPDEMPAAALWWRLSRHLAPAVLTASNSTEAGTVSTLRPAWTGSLVPVVGEERALRVLADPSWPALVAAVTEATAGGWQPEQVLQTAYELLGALSDGHHHPGGAGLPADELTTALVWRIAMLNEADTHAADAVTGDLPPDPAALDQLPPEDLDQLEPPADLFDSTAGDVALAQPLDVGHDVDHDDWFAGLQAPPEDPAEEHPHPSRTPAGDVAAPALTNARPERATAVAAEAAAGSIVSQERLIQLNEQALAFFVDQYTDSWGAAHLRERLGSDLAQDPRFQPGQAPASWTALTDQLRELGATDDELLAAGMASTARTGRLIDRFRDRLMLPIHSADGEVVGFIGRRNPDTPDAGPKYLNTGETDVFSKGAQLYGLHANAAALNAGARPALVEGPVDAIAVTLAGDGQVVGVATLGTAFTDRQADQLLPYLGDRRPEIIVATDNDQAGRKAATRAYWQLTARGANPAHLTLPDGQDPAQLLQEGGPDALRNALASPPTLARTLIDAAVERYADQLHHVQGPLLAARAAADVIGALPPQHWLEHISYLDSLVDLTPGTTHMAVLDAGQAWTEDPEAFTRRQLGEAPRPPRPAAAVTPAPAGRPAGRNTTGADRPSRSDPEEITQQWAGDVWFEVGRNVDPRLVEGSDWRLLAAALDRASRAGYDVQQHLPRLAGREPLPEHQPARALHYRLIQECEAAITPRPQPAQLAEQTAAAQARIAEQTRRQDDQQALRRAAGRPGTPSPKQVKAAPAAQPTPAPPPRERGPRR